MPEVQEGGSNSVGDRVPNKLVRNLAVGVREWLPAAVLGSLCRRLATACGWVEEEAGRATNGANEPSRKITLGSAGQPAGGRLDERFGRTSGMTGSHAESQSDRRHRSYSRACRRHGPQLNSASNLIAPSLALPRTGCVKVQHGLTDRLLLVITHPASHQNPIRVY